MSHVLRVAIVDPHDTGREELKRLLLGLDSIWLEAECSRYEFFADVVAQTNPEIGIVALDFDQEKALDLVAKVTQQSPDCAIFVISASHDGTVILKAMRAGAKEFLTQPLRIDDLLAAIERLTERRFGRGDQKARGPTVVALTGVTGGVGVSTIAVNLGCALARNDKNSVVLVDLDLCLGDADVLLDAIPDYTIVDVAQNVTRLDFSLLKRSLTKHSSGLFLLPRPIQLEDVSLVTGEDIQRVIGLLKASFTHLVIDLSKAFTPLDMTAMEMAQHIVLVTQLDLPCLRNVVRLLMSFNNIQGMADKVKIVVNRTGLESGQINIKKAEEIIGREIFWQIPNDYRACSESRNNGVPLLESAPRSAVTHAILGLAEALCGDSAKATEKKPSKSGLFKLFAKS
jgi:pilus assembly protein CpaE